VVKGLLINFGKDEKLLLSGGEVRVEKRVKAGSKFLDTNSPREGKGGATDKVSEAQTLPVVC